MRASSIVLILLVYSIYQLAIAMTVLLIAIIGAAIKVGYVAYNEKHKEIDK